MVNNFYTMNDWRLYSTTDMVNWTDHGSPAGLKTFSWSTDSAWAPQGLVDAISGLSFLTHFNSISKGVIDLRDLVYFALLVGTCLYANTIVLELKKAD